MILYHRAHPPSGAIAGWSFKRTACSMYAYNCFIPFFSAGMILFYVLLQLGLWWLFHIAILFWKVVFPFHARSYSEVKLRFIHVTCVAFGLLLPLCPIIATMADFAEDIRKQPENSPLRLMFLSGGLGFRSTRFPALLCTGTNPDVVFYTLVLAGDLILAIGCTMLLVMFWSVHRIKNKTSDTQVCQISTV